MLPEIQKAPATPIAEALINNSNFRMNNTTAVKNGKAGKLSQREGRAA